MRMCRLYIPLYDWNVTAFFDACAEDEAVILDELWYICCPEHTMARVERNLRVTSWIRGSPIPIRFCVNR